MFNWIVKWGVKKYVLEIVNKALDAYNVNVTRSRAIVSVYIRKIEALGGVRKIRIMGRDNIH